ncbi:glycosyltransferase [Desulfovibrio sp. UIB00]|uniref:glycosyltransferase family 2 protein n=1 Tax=Desulfovibrio sp. UIB00 TaxID=2804314 RepID=UPI001F0DEEA7|nr:glycosyltransferase [Desulfovibrio sp. UIB00]
MWKISKGQAMHSCSPIISFIIATFNAGETLRRCLNSLLECDTHQIEIIIKDACSVDDTQNIVDEYLDRLPIRFICQRDTGISDAWNQAVTADGGPQGQWILFLGADDFICSPHRLKATVAALGNLAEHAEYAAAPVTLVNGDGFAVDTLFPSRSLKRDLPMGMPLPHQGLFHRRCLFSANRFDTSLRITGDYSFLCSTLKPDNLVYLDLPALVCMSLGGVSGNLEGLARRNREVLRVSRKFFPDCARGALWKRLVLSYLFNGLSILFGAQFATRCADYYRRLLRKTPLWTTREPLSGAMRLPEDSATTCSSQQPVFSLLVATLNRGQPLQKFLDCLLEQTIGTSSFEVLIADQNPSGFLQPLIDGYADRLSIRVVQVPNIGVSHARNVLVPLAHGQYIAFPDDDCFYEADTLLEAQKIFESHLHVHAIQGSWSAPGRDRKLICPSNRLCTSLSIFKRGETYVQFFRKESVNHIGLFDTMLGPGTGLPYGCGEDTDYLLRAIEKGLTVVYAPSVHVHHNEVDVMAIMTNKQKIISYATGRMYLLRKHKLPLWFQVFNIIYPLLRIPFEGIGSRKYRFMMFKARLHGFFYVRSSSALKG